MRGLIVGDRILLSDDAIFRYFNRLSEVAQTYGHIICMKTIFELCNNAKVDADLLNFDFHTQFHNQTYIQIQSFSPLHSYANFCSYLRFRVSQSANRSPRNSSTS